MHMLAGSAKVTPAPIESSVSRRLLDAASAHANDVALTDPQTSIQLNYEEFLASVRCLVPKLGEHELIALLFERCAEMIVGIYATILSGAAYVPVEQEHPTARKLLILEDSSVQLLLTLNRLCARVPEGYAGRALAIDGAHNDRSATHSDGVTPGERLVGDESLLYVFCTSTRVFEPVHSLRQ